MNPLLAKFKLLVELISRLMFSENSSLFGSGLRKNQHKNVDMCNCEYREVGCVCSQGMDGDCWFLVICRHHFGEQGQG